VEQLTKCEFARLYQSTLRPLWTYIYRATGNAADADDIAQEAFCRVLRADVAGLPDQDLRRYLFGVASHLIADRWRKHKREHFWRLFRQPENSVEPASSNDVILTFGALKPRDRALLWLAYVEQNTHEEIAARLHVKPGSVKVLLARARQRLRALLTGEEA
jgi:RNA polymerase sigma-70 factor (ECF subfamily)